MQTRHHSAEIHERRNTDDKSLSASSEDQLLASPSRGAPSKTLPERQANYSVTSSNHNNNSTMLKQSTDVTMVTGETPEASSDSSVPAPSSRDSNTPSSPLQNSALPKKPNPDGTIQEDPETGKDNESTKGEVNQHFNYLCFYMKEVVGILVINSCIFLIHDLLSPSIHLESLS